MSTVIMLFILPIGILIFFWDRKNYAQSLALFEAYIDKMQHAELDDTAKMQRIDAMFYENGYRIVSREPAALVVEQKHFNIGLLFIFFGLMNYFGIFFYIIFYRFVQKPRRLCVEPASAHPLRRC